MRDMRKSWALLAVLVITAGCVSSPGTYGYAFVENVPENASGHAVSVGSIDAPEELQDALQEAKNASVTPTYGEPERVSTPLSKNDYNRLVSNLSGSTPGQNYTYVSYRGETFKIYFEKSLIDE
jgi:hypothetical protein